MPWNDSYFPRSMASLPSAVRHKAIEIANALLAEGYEEGRAIRIAISQARRWAGFPPPGRSASGGRARRT